MTGTITTGNMPRLLQEGLNKVFGDSYDRHPKQYPVLFDEENSSKAFEVDAQLEGLSLAEVKDEGDEVAFDDFSQGFTPKYRMLTYAKGYIVTEEALEDELYGQLKTKTGTLGFIMVQTKENVAANIINRGFNSAYTMIDGDGVELFSTAHINGPSGGTFSNKLAIDANLEEVSLQDMLILIGNATDPRGNKISLQATDLCVPVAQQFNAQRILGSVLQNDTTNNATNAVRDMNSVRDGFSVNNYFTNPNAWFLKTNAPNGLKCFNRRALRYGQDNAFTSGNMRQKADERYALGWTDPRGIYGTSGA